MDQVFVTYSGEDGHRHAALLYATLVQRFGEDLVFLDDESISAGADFAEELLTRVRSAPAVVAVLAPRWSSAREPGTWVRRAIAEAFAAGVRVIPVLTDQAELPAQVELPADIAALSGCRYVSWRRREPAADMARLAIELAGVDSALAAARRIRDDAQRQWPLADEPAELTRPTVVRDDMLGGRPWLSAAGPVPHPVPRQVPPVPAGFVGRERDLTALTRTLDPAARWLLDTATVMIVTGPAGIGKTWLAVRWANRYRDRFPDGSLFANLDAFSPTRPAALPSTVLFGFLQALGVPAGDIPSDGGDRAALYRRLIAGKRMLIVLDNASDYDQIAPLLPPGNTCTVLVTSRRRLSAWLPERGMVGHSVGPLSNADARALLAESLGSERITAEPDAVADLLDLCAGLPLALRIVADRAQRQPALPLRALAEELQDAAVFLNATPTNDPDGSLSAAFSASARLLSPPARTLFASLAITLGTELATVAALASLSPEQAGSALAELQEHSLVQIAAGQVAMLRPIRLFAAETGYRRLAEGLAGHQPGGASGDGSPIALDPATIPVIVYVDNATAGPRVERALGDLLAEYGVEIIRREPPVVRSWFRRMTAAFTRAGGPDVGRRLLRELDRGVELRTVDEVQARVDAAQGDVVAKLLTALADTNTALIQIGSVLLIKVDGIPVVRNLTQAELACLQRHPHLSQNPADCLRALEAMLDRSDGDGTTGGPPALTGGAADESGRRFPDQRLPGSGGM